MIGTIVLLIFIEIILRPRLDITKEKKLLLWYRSREGRKYIVLF